MSLPVAQGLLSLWVCVQTYTQTCGERGHVTGFQCFMRAQGYSSYWWRRPQPALGFAFWQPWILSQIIPWLTQQEENSPRIPERSRKQAVLLHQKEREPSWLHLPLRLQLTKHFHLNPRSWGSGSGPSLSSDVPWSPASCIIWYRKEN